MNNERLLAILAVLPDPDFIGSARLDARLGSNTAYKASTVAQLMERSAQAERDMWLQLCTELLDTELGEVACTGSDAPCEDVLGRIKAMVTRHTDAPVVRQRDDSTEQVTGLIHSSGHTDASVHEPQLCPVCDGEWHAEDCELGNEVARRLKAEKAVAQLRPALRLAREGYASEAITGLPVLPQWRERTMTQIDEALGA